MIENNRATQSVMSESDSFSLTLQQLNICIRRIWMEKIREPAGFFLETFAHLIGLGIVVAIFYSSSVYRYPAQSYARVEIHIPPDGVQTGTLSRQTLLDQYQKIMSGPLPTLDLDQYLALGRFIKSNYYHMVKPLTWTPYGSSLPIFLNPGILYFSPNSSSTLSLVNYLNITYKEFRTVDVKICSTEQDAISSINDSRERPFALIHLEDDDYGNMRYKVRQIPNMYSSTNIFFSSVKSGFDFAYQNYFISGFISLQRGVNEWIHSRAVACLLEDGVAPSFNIPFSTSEYTLYSFFTQVGNLLGLLLVMPYIFVLTRQVKYIVEDKELGLRQIFFVMGLSSLAYQLGLFIFFSGLYAWVALTSTIILSASIFSHTSFGILFLLHIVFSFALCSTGWLLGTLLKRAKVATVLTPVFLFFASLPRYFFISSQPSDYIWWKFAFGLFPPTSYIYSVDYIAMYEYQGLGSPLPAFSVRRISLSTSIVLLTTTMVACALLTIFAEQSLASMVKHLLIHMEWIPHNASTITSHSETAGSAAVTINNLYKTFRGADMVLNGLSMQMYDGEFSCLLGQNGAGKSTLVSILIGLLQPTRGDIFIMGVHINDRLSQWGVRRQLGICSQANVLSPNLTVEEHILFLGQLRGLSESLLSSEMDSLLRDLDLDQKRKTRVKLLSGGMKRKVCLAMALIGHPKVVILDEPTSGVDPISRRNIWGVLLERKRGSATLLTTHFMDEAETLSDRVFMLSHGRILCQGSVSELKHYHPQGYRISFSRSSSMDSESDDVSAVLEAEMLHVVSDVKSLSSNPSEITFGLPVTAKFQLGALFRRLRHVRWRCYDRVCLRSTSLEQVVLSLLHKNSGVSGDDKKTLGFAPKEDVNPLSIGSNDLDPEVGIHSLRVEYDTDASCSCGRMMQQLWRKWLLQKRDRMNTFANIVLPTCLLVLSIAVLLIDLAPNQKPLQLHNLSFQDCGDGLLPTVSVSSNYPFDLIPKDNASIAFTNSSNSVEMSSLSESISLEGLRWDGGVVHEDQIPVKIFVNTTWLKEHPKALDIIYPILLVNNFVDSPLKSVDGLDNGFGRSQSDEIFETCSLLFSQSIIDQPTFLRCLPNGVFSMSTAWDSAYTLLHRSPAMHSIGIFHAEMAKESLKSCGAATTVEAINHPLPISFEDSLFNQIQLAVVLVVLMLIPLCFIPSSFATFVVKDRVTMAKQLQRLCSTTSTEYWSILFLTDFICYLFPVSLFLVASLGLGTVTKNILTHSPETFICLTLILLCYGLAAIPFCYLLSTFFIVPSSATIFVLLVNIVSGLGFTIAYFLIVSGNSSSSKPILVWVLESLFRIFPSFNLGNGLISICTNYYQNELRRNKIGYLTWDVCGVSIYVLLIEMGIYFLLVFAVDSDVWNRLQWYLCKRKTSGGESDKDLGSADHDVLNETIFVNGLLQHHGSFFPPSPLGHPLVISHLSKFYLPSRYCHRTKNVQALRDLSLACSEGERFGLLGVNGAGKTTTMHILTGELAPSGGEVYIGGLKLPDSKALSLLGYCPQEDPILEQMNAYETLWFYGRLRGIDRITLRKRIDKLIKQTGLEPHAHRPASIYSGGNKRRLSLAVALIGDPKVLLLDEPSTGMDAEARRQMWSIIRDISVNRTVVLVSHSMEEIEALCTRVGVLVAGQLRCLGSIPHLKAKYGAGYQVDFRCSDARKVDECLAACHTFLVPEACEETADCELKAEDGYVTVEERCAGFVRLHVGHDLDLGAAFDGFDTYSESLGIYDYSISLGSLDRVFMKTVQEVANRPC